MDVCLRRHGLPGPGPDPPLGPGLMATVGWAAGETGEAALGTVARRLGVPDGPRACSVRWVRSSLTSQRERGEGGGAPGSGCQVGAGCIT